MKKIPISNNKIVLVDDEDFDHLIQWKWRAAFDKGNNSFYAIRSIYVDRKRTSISMHRSILKPPKNLQVDHINHDTLDNRRSNLRLVTCSENARNSKLRKNNKSGYCGVSLCKRTNKWVASIRVNGRKLSLGYFVEINDAVSARLIANKKYGYHDNHGMAIAFYSGNSSLPKAV